MKSWIILPAFNEEESIPNLLPKLKDFFSQSGLEYEVILLDDGSTDGTVEAARRLQRDYPMRILKHDINRGLGETERDAFEFVAVNGAETDVAIRMDCDDTHEPQYIGPLLEKIATGFDVVNTSRFRPGGGQKGVSRYRALVSLAANGFMKVLFNIRGVRDYSCGFRAYRVSALRDAVRIFGNSFIQLKGLGFTSTLETIVKLKLLGCRFSEVPFMLRYDKKLSASKMVSSITTLGYLAMAILYHWPFGGWKWFYRKLAVTREMSPDKAFELYGAVQVKKPTISQIGG